jgi:hypothetical protein
MESDPDDKPLKEVWVYLSDDEAMNLSRALDEYFSEPQRGPAGTATSLTPWATSCQLASGNPTTPESFASRFAKPS